METLSNMEYIKRNDLISKKAIYNCLRFVVITAILTFISGTLSAQDYVYRPINPAFGGNTYNYSWLLSSADAQKPKEEDETSSLFDGFGESSDPLADFTEQLQNSIINELTDRILQEQFGDFELEQGEYKVGNYQINITESNEGLQIHILDTQTGGESKITVPNL